MKKIAKLLIISLLFTQLLSLQIYASSTEINELKNDIENLIQRLERQDETITNLREQLNEVEQPGKAAPKRPILMIIDPLTVDLSAGSSKSYDITIKNLTSDTAKNILTTVSSDTPGVVASFTSNDNYKSELGNKSTYKSKLNISIDSNVKSGYYTLKFKHSYLDSNNEDKSSDSIMQIKVENQVGSSNVIIRDIGVSSSLIKAGSDFSLSAVLENQGTENITDVQIAIDGLTSDTVYIKDSTNILSFPKLGKGIAQNFNVPLTSNKKIKNGSYPVNLKLTYTDNLGEAKSKDYSYYISIIDENTKDNNPSEIYISNITAPPNTYNVGNNFSMTVTVTNKSNILAKNIKVTAKPEGEGAVVPKSTSVLQISALPPGESRELTYSFAPTATSRTQNYVVGFTLEYETGKVKEDDTKEIITFTQFQGVNVSNPEADKKENEKEEEDKKTSVPKIIIKAYQSDPVIVKAGQEFNLNMTFLNTNSSKPIKNIKAYLTVDEGTEKKGSVFSPVNSSNTFYIDKMEPKGEATKMLRFYTIPDAAPKTYSLNVNFEYEDMENNEYKSTEIVGISVKQITKLDVSEYEIQEFGSMYQPISINFEMFNTGKVALSNLMVTMEGNFETSQKSTYYGNFNVSSTEYYDITITPIEAGLQKGKIIISYEDDSGEKITVDREFTIDVSEESPMMEGNNEFIDPETGYPIDPMTGEIIDPMTGEPLKKGLPKPTLIIGGIIAVVVIGAAVGGFLLIKKRKQKDFLDLDE